MDPACHSGSMTIVLSPDMIILSVLVYCCGSMGHYSRGHSGLKGRAYTQWVNYPGKVCVCGGGGEKREKVEVLAVLVG